MFALRPLRAEANGNGFGSGGEIRGNAFGGSAVGPNSLEALSRVFSKRSPPTGYVKPSLGTKEKAFR